MGAAIASVATVAQVTSRNLPSRDYPPSTDQALAVQQIATSGRRLDLLIGPAGTGKSTTMAGLRAVWEHEHGPGSVLGLAPSAAAAEVLARELGIATENTAKWLYEHRREAANGDAADTAASRWTVSRDQLVIVDEASLAGTFALDELTAAARDAGAKVLLVGDQHQLSGVEAGGMFRALIQDRGAGVAQLEDVRRFNNTWEKEGSLLLRQGRDDAIEFYEQHERISSGTRDELIAELYDRWKRDTDLGRSSLMIAADAATVDELNRRARADRVASGQVSPNGVELSGDQRAGVGDLIVTRQNDRQITTRRGWVKNGDHWIASATHWDGRLTVERDGSGGKVELPAAYVAEHVELGYATTAHRAQGRTVDTAHAMITSATNREALYVAATRGRDSNRLYVDTTYDPDPASGHEGLAEPRTAAGVLAAVLANEGTELAAHAQIRAGWDAAESIVRLHAEYQTIARHAQAERWDRLITSSGLNSDEAQRTLTSDAYGPLIAALQDAEARGLDVNSALPKLVGTRQFSDADDIAAVLHYRVDAWVERAASRREPEPDMITGLIPRAKGITDPDMERALAERADAIERRADAVLRDAIDQNAAWVQRLGKPPADERRRAAWLSQARTVAAYRDRWGATDALPVGGAGASPSIEQAVHHRRATAAAARATTLSRPSPNAAAVPDGAVDITPGSRPGLGR